MTWWRPNEHDWHEKVCICIYVDNVDIFLDIYELSTIIWFGKLQVDLHGLDCGRRPSFMIGITFWFPCGLFCWMMTRTVLKDDLAQQLGP